MVDRGGFSRQAGDFPQDSAASVLRPRRFSQAF
jgi:hypothetical protein